MNSPTRRDWMVTISQAAVGVGLAGKLQGAAPATGPLPPGLYEASGNHLGHALMSSEQYHPIVAGCPTDYVRPRSGPFKPEFFTASEFPVIQRFTELLLGEPAGSVSQEVAEWIDLRVASSHGIRQAESQIPPPYRSLSVAYYGSRRPPETVDAAAICRAGLSWMPANFLTISSAQQVALLDTVSDDRADKQTENAGTQLFEYLKAETIRGYYTSKAGLKELDFKGNAFYASSPGCKTKT